MTLQEFSRDIAPLINILLAICGIASLVMLWLQTKQTTLWNKLSFQQHFINIANSTDLQRAVYTRAKDLGINVERNQPLTEDEVNKLWADDLARFALRAYLNELETFCGSVQIGCLDHDWARNLFSPKIILAFKVFEPWIQHVRKHYGNNVILIEMEKTALQWEQHNVTHSESEMRKIHELRMRLQCALGIKKKV